MNTENTKEPTDVMRSTMPPSKSTTWRGRAEELVANFPGVDRNELLIQLTASYLMDFKYGNKREEREACNFLNLLQAEAVSLLKQAGVLKAGDRNPNLMVTDNNNNERKNKT